jgi:hypothetical protein
MFGKPNIFQKVVIGRFIRLCPGGRHSWFESNVGPIRKPVNTLDSRFPDGK